MLSKKGRLLYALHTVKTLFRDAGIENAKVEVELNDVINKIKNSYKKEI